MLPFPELALLLAGKSKVWGLVRKLGGFAFIPLGLADNSVVPLPGSMDAVLIVLAGSNHELWWYYALMATAGSVVGGFVTYRIGREGGKESLEKKLNKRQVEKVYGIFDKYGFFSVAVPAILPPPVPIVPFLLAAGAMNYPRHKFVLSLGLGRAVRFGLLGFLASRYGHEIFSFFKTYYKPIAIGLGALAAAGVIGIVVYQKWYRKRHGGQGPAAPRSEKPRQKVA